MTGPDVVDATLPGPTLPARPPLVRRPDDRVVAGVCDAVARHLMVGVLAVRVVFVVLVAFGGAGVMAYAGLWAFMQQGASPAGNGSARMQQGASPAGNGSSRMQQGASPGDGAPARTPRELTTAPGQRRPAGREHGRSVALLLVALGVVLLVAQLGLIPVGVVVPLLLGGAGVAVIWRQIDEGRRPADRAGWWRLGAGAGLLLLGLGAFLIASDQLLAARQALAVILVIVLGLVVVTAPWWRRLVVELGAERRERIRTQERAEVAAHLHDSVLQTLALIQRHVDSPREVARLARGQERELRSWLYGRAPEAASRFAAALEGMAADVEDSYAVAVEAVLVGDCDVDPAVAALVQAAREAVVNAARHSGVETVSLYAEVEPRRVVVYVRDRGVGFDPADVPADRQGIRGSIHGRMARFAGHAELRSAPGAGTEVELSVDRADVAAVRG